MTNTNDLPCNIPMEQTLLGACLNHDELWWPVFATLTEEDFFLPQHAEIFNAARDLTRAGLSGTVTQVLGVLNKPQDNDVSSAYEITIDLNVDMMHMRVSVEQVEEYAKSLRTYTTKRGMIHATQRANAELVSTSSATDDQLNRVRGILNDAMAEREVDDEIPGAALAESVFHGLTRDDPPVGPSTGFSELSDLHVRLKPGTLTIIAGRPSMGKSSLATSIAAHVAITEKIPTMYFTLEVSSEDMGRNVLAAHSKTDHDNMRDLPQPLVGSIRELKESPLLTYDSADVSAGKVRALTQMRVNTHKVQVVIVDYLQILRRDPSKTSREREVAEAIALLRQTARECNVAMVVLAQLNRGVESRESKKPGTSEKTKGVPRLSDLRESGSIEQDADCVLLMHRPQYYAGKDEITGDGTEPHECNVYVAKNRAGPTGVASLAFHPKSTSIRPWYDLPCSRAPAPPSLASKAKQFFPDLGE